MGKVLVAYYSVSGRTETMAQYIGEGIRFAGHEAVLKKIEDIKTAVDLAGYDGYIVGSPTISLDVPGAVRAFLSLAPKAKLRGKLMGSFGAYAHEVSYKHEAHAPAIIFDALQRVCKMKPFELGAFSLKEELVETTEGMKTCQDYGRVFGQKLAAS